MTTKPPTPQSVSALLKEAGYPESLAPGREGFTAVMLPDSGGVLIRWFQIGTEDVPAERRQLSAIADALRAAGCEVDDSQLPRLIPSVRVAAPTETEEG